MIFLLCGGHSKTAAACCFQQTPHLPRREEIITSCCLLVVCSSLKSHSWMLIIKFSSVRFAIYFCTALPCLCNYGESFYSYSAEGCFLLDSRGLQLRVSKEPWLVIHTWSHQDTSTRTPGSGAFIWLPTDTLQKKTQDVVTKQDKLRP